jgi:hypothetical protein
MGTTTNNGWPTPVATDLVKDGWEAIKDLGDAIDTTLGVYAPSTSGLTLINTTSFSGVATQSVNDVFSATYDNYRVLLNITSSSASPGITLRYRVSGTDATGNDYHSQEISAASTTVSGERSSPQTFIDRVAVSITTTGGIASMDIFNPFATEYTNLFSNYAFFDATAIRSRAGQHRLANSYTGFTLISGSGTITGNVSVYGYNK